MNVGYGVVWREGGVERPGRLTLSIDLIRLSGFEPAAPVREVEIDQIGAAQLRRPETDTGRASLVLTMRDGTQVEIESAVDEWIANSLLERVFAHVLGDESKTRQMIIAVKLKPGRLEAARELLRAGPPFDPAITPLVVHSAFLLEDEVLFMFELDDAADRDQVLDFDVWGAVARWRELSTGEVRLAEQAYSWTRSDTGHSQSVRAGLGL